MNLKLIITDLDGSLLNDKSMISESDHHTLKTLGEKGIIRVIATGRNYWSAENVLNLHPEIDYAIISTGLGIIDYPKQEFIKTHFLTKEDVQLLTNFLLKEKVDFMIHNLLPDNHFVKCFDAGTMHPDFMMRWAWYKDFASDLPDDINSLEPASQMLAFFPHNSKRLQEIRRTLTDYHIIRTTSPITNHYDWMEIFPKNVSKGDALKWLCEKLKVNLEDTLCLGNDYNDLDMLRIAGESYVTANAPEDLRKDFKVTVSNNEDPLTQICERYL